MIEWLLQSVEIPVWALLTLAGYQRVFALGEKYQKQRRSANNNGTDVSDD